MKKIDRLLLKLLAASAILFLFSLVFSNKGKSAQKSVESAILNQKYKNEVAEIEITEKGEAGSESITLAQHGDFWLLTKKDEQTNSELCTLADTKIINPLIENAIKIRKMYTISDRTADYDSLGLGEKNATTLTFLKNDGTLFTKVYFGHADSLKNRIFIRSERSKTAYECENDFQQYLTTKTNYWSEGEILPEVKNPVQITLETHATLKADESSGILGKPTLNEKSDNFTSKAHALLSLRHGTILSEEVTTNAIKIAELTAQDGNGRIAQITFFEKTENAFGEEAEQSYFYTKSVTPSEIDSAETRFAFYSERAAYEISAWTFSRIKSAFGL